MTRNYRELIVWQKAMDLVVAAYSIAEGFPPDDGFGLTSQVRRAAVSIASNVAEGEGRSSYNEFGRFLLIAHDSLR